jgi:hypothetical protein
MEKDVELLLRVSEEEVIKCFFMIIRIYLKNPLKKIRDFIISITRKKEINFGTVTIIE